jgi:uncharacterized RDD family membrane protein YckC
MAPAPAPLPRRTAAFLCDQAAVTAIVVLPALATGTAPGTVVAPGATRRTLFVAAMVVAFLYHLAFEWQAGQTPGKYAFDLRVVHDDGSRLSLRGAVVRNALRLVDGLGYWSVAVAVVLLRGDGKRLGDWAARTLVVRGDHHGLAEGQPRTR